MIDLEHLDWNAIERALFDDGYAHLRGVLPADACEDLRAYYERDELFRSRVIMERHHFGRGEYKYFSYPLPPLVSALRETAYRPLAAIANRWHEALHSGERVPQTLQMMLELCTENDQQRPTALLLRYREGDYNCLHQDLYGKIAFPFQMAGDCIIFPNRYRPVRGRAGTYRTTFRHGVSRLKSGERHTLGIIFHDAQ